MSERMMYKGYPVVSDGNKVYFGEPFEPFMVVFTVLDNNDGIPSRILVQLHNTDPALAFSAEKIVKESERKNLFDAYELGAVWLSGALKK